MMAQLQLPLLPEPQGASSLEVERVELVRRIKTLPPNSHRRVALQYKAQMLTNQILQLACQNKRKTGSQ